MPFFDRFWQINVCAGLLHLVLAGAIVVQAAVGASSLAAIASFSEIVALVLALVGSGYILAGLLARGRKRRRLAAISGNADAVPLALPIARPERAPDVGHKPLSLLYRVTRSGRMTVAALWLAWAMLLAAVLSAILIVPSLFAALPWTAGMFGLTDVTSAGLVLLLADLVWWIFILLRWRPVLISGPIGVEASAEGMIEHRRGRRPRQVRWYEAQLLEVASGSSADLLWGQARRYTLYGQHSAVEWRVAGEGNRLVEPIGASVEASRWRAESLLDLAVARTGLAPRTFDPSLRPPPQPPAPSRSNTLPTGWRRPVYLLAGLLLLTLFAGLIVAVIAALLAFAIAVVRVPLTTAPLLNVLVAASIVLPMLYSLIAAVVAAFKPRRRSNADVTSGSPMTRGPSEDPQAVYVLTLRTMSVSDRAVTTIFGMLLSVDMLPGLAAEGLFKHLPSLAWISLASTDIFHYVAAVLLLFLGMAGLAAAITTAFSAPLVLRTEPDALVIEVRRKQQRIPWDQVESVVSIGRRGDSMYTVTGRGGAPAVKWLTRWKTIAPGVATGVRAVTAKELAALVAARSGVPLTTREA